jgi:hypothetical protein
MASDPGMASRLASGAGAAAFGSFRERTEPVVAVGVCGDELRGERSRVEWTDRARNSER